MKGAALAALSCLIVACGSSGDDSSGDAPPEDPPVQGPLGVAQPAVTLTGSLYLGDTGTPAAGYELWILDHSDGGMGRFPVGTAGEIAVPLSIFRVGHRYTFHVVKGDRLLGDLDFGASTDGAQATLIYDGGYGFDLGEVIANVTSRGNVDVEDPGLGAEMGGGFSLDVDSTATFATLPPPDGVESIHFKSQLVVFDPVTLLYAFYHRDTYPERYAEALLDQSRIVVSLSTRSKHTVSRFYLYEGGQWLDASRLAASGADGSRGEAPLWSTSGHFVPEAGSKSFFASVYTGALLPENSFALFRVQPASGATLTVPRLLGRVHAVPPKPTAIALDGGTPAAIDYALPEPSTGTDSSTDTATDTATETATDTATSTSTSTATMLGSLQDETLERERPQRVSADQTEENTAATPQGLLTPFCYADHGVTVDYAPPLDEDGEAIVGARYGVVAVVLDYYGVGDDGRNTLLETAVEDFPGDFAAAYTDPAATDPSRSWDPETRTATFTWTDEAAAAMSSARLSLWPEVFLESAGGSDVSRIRLRVYFRGKDDPGEAASAMWLRRGC